MYKALRRTVAGAVGVLMLWDCGVTQAEACGRLAEVAMPGGIYLESQTECGNRSFCSLESVSRPLTAGKTYRFFYKTGKGKNKERIFYLRKSYKDSNLANGVYIRRSEVRFACIGSDNRVFIKKKWPSSGFYEISERDYRRYHASTGISNSIKGILDTKFHVRYFIDSQKNVNICVATNDESRRFVFAMDDGIWPRGVLEKLVAAWPSAGVNRLDALPRQKIRHEIEIVAAEPHINGSCVGFSVSAKGSSLTLEVADVDNAAQETEMFFQERGMSRLSDAQVSEFRGRIIARATLDIE